MGLIDAPMADVPSRNCDDEADMGKAGTAVWPLDGWPAHAAIVELEIEPGTNPDPSQPNE